MKYFALLAVLVLALACGSKSVAPTFESGGAAGTFSTNAGSGGRSFGSSGSGGASGEAGSGGGAAGSSLAPAVKITSPVAVSDPNVGPVVTANPVQVLCDASAAMTTGATIDSQTVKIEAFDAKGVAIGTSATASTQNPLDANEYGAKFSMVGVANGPISFKCSAADKSTPPNIGTTTTSTFFDQGPTITVASPLPNSSYSLKNKVLFKFTVTAAPLTDSDKFAAVDMTAGKVTLTVDNQVISLAAAQDPTDPTTYSINVDLNNAVEFPKTPAGTVPVEITAWDTRGTQATMPYTFNIDGTPPVIQIVSPATGQVVGGHVTVEFTVTDSQSGVDQSSVNIALNNLPPVSFDPTPNSGWTVSADGKTFDYGFDSGSSAINGAIQVHVEIQAADNATNVSAGATEDLYLDNQPPSVDLDPPNLQEREILSGTNYACSEPFDPLGTSPNDLSVVPTVGIYRALVWDNTNSAQGETVLHFAGTDQSSVILYAQPDPATPLLIAKHNTNGLCDDLNTDAASKPPLEDLVPIAPQGSSYFDAAAPTIALTCGDGSDGNAPKGLCAANSSDLTRVIDHAVVGATEPVIYAINSVDPAECTGQNWSLPDSGLPNGWVCIAVLAKDKVGNLGISPPLRVCLNSNLNGKVQPDCAIFGSTASMTPPSCTDGCTPPGHFIPYAFNSLMQPVPHVLDLPH
jgi:hypothetical protein